MRTIVLTPTGTYRSSWANVCVALGLATLAAFAVLAVWIAFGALFDGTDGSLYRAALGVFSASLAVAIFPIVIPMAIAAIVLPLLAVAVGVRWLAHRWSVGHAVRQASRARLPRRVHGLDLFPQAT
jgi:hypothetical protein